MRVIFIKSTRRYSVLTMFLALCYFATNFLSSQVSNIKLMSREVKEKMVNLSSPIKTLKISVYEIDGPLDRKNEERIFFHEASGNNYLDLRQTCAVESAAFHNPKRQIQLLMHTLEKPNACSQWYQVLANYPNVELVLVDDGKYFTNTSLETWYIAGKWRKSHFKIEHFADYLRILTLLKGGGLYLDLDFVVLKPLKEATLQNFFVLEDDRATVFGNSVFHLQYNHPLGELLVRHLEDDYDPNSWGYHGSAVITAAMRDTCGFKEGNLHSNMCKNLKWLPYSSFFPVPYDQWESLFYHSYNVKFSVNKLNKTFAIHAWNKLSHHFPVTLDSSQLYSWLAAKHCPLTVYAAKSREP